MKKLKALFWSWHVQDNLRSATVSILWLAMMYFSGDMLKLLLALYSGDFTGVTFYAFFAILLRMLIRAGVLYLLLMIKKFFPKLELPIPNVELPKK